MNFKKPKFIIGFTIILIALGTLFYLGASSSMIAYLKVRDLNNPQKNILSSKVVKVTGTVKPGSIKSSNLNSTLKFILQDSDSANISIPVVFNGTVPDNFRSGNIAVVRGELNADNVFIANQLQAKCPSKYEASVPDKGDGK
ncbi:MAG TPA: cytochrome c maturation protein CcmE [Ignavibacteria bacterium]|nr:cytochrome c maturation protein CcmE [Ignavibacteria bacterium]